MVEVQIGSTALPIIILPTIDGKAVTVTQIKNDFSNYFVNDGATPINFILEYKTRDGSKVNLSYNNTKSSETEIWFEPPDTVYATKEVFTMVVYWTIGIEKVPTTNMFVLDVQDLHNEP